MEKKKDSVTISVRREKGCFLLTNGRGQEWKIPKGFSERAALSMLVYGALMNQENQISCYSSKYKISIEVEVLDGE